MHVRQIRLGWPNVAVSSGLGSRLTLRSNLASLLYSSLYNDNKAALPLKLLNNLSSVVGGHLIRQQSVDSSQREVATSEQK